MAGELLLINPAKRRARKSNPKAKRRARRNPIKVAGLKPARRRRNPISTFASRRRRRNPISVRGAASSLMGSLRDAVIGGAGAVAIDAAYGAVAPMLPAALQRTPGKIGAGDALKAVFTFFLGRVLDKPTRGLSKRAAAGALVVQASDMIRTFVPASLTLGSLAYSSPARVVQGSPRVGPNSAQMSPAFQVPRNTPLLSAYVPARSTLNGRAGVMTGRR